MPLRILVACALVFAAPHAAAISFDRYHSQDEINGFLAATAREHPRFARAQLLGRSQQGRGVHLLVLSEPATPKRAALYINGTHHGNEKASTESVLALIDFLVANRRDPLVARLLSRYAIYLQPLVNPDGHAADIRGDAWGRDPNRDYVTPAKPLAESFKTAPAQIVRQLTERVSFRAAVALHAGMEGVLWPWGHTPERAADTDLFFTLSRLAAKSMGISHYLPSFADYPTHGEFIDYMYSQFGTLALTFEVSTAPAPAPSELPAVTRRAVGGLMAFMLSVMDHDEGLLALAKAPSSINSHAATAASAASTPSAPSR